MFNKVFPGLYLSNVASPTTNTSSALERIKLSVLTIPFGYIASSPFSQAVFGLTPAATTTKSAGYSPLSVFTPVTVFSPKYS